ncbi:MAG: glycoside hydrolase family 97 protein [Fidelibacterota bacterium]
MKNFIQRGVLMSVIVSLSTVAQDFQVRSPDGRMAVNVSLADGLTASVYYKNQTVINSLKIDLLIENSKCFADHPAVARSAKQEIRQTVTVAVPLKNRTIEDHYNQLQIEFDNHYTLCLRVFNDGFAYRLATALDGEIKVRKEQLHLNLSPDVVSYFPEEQSLMSHYERSYAVRKISDIEAGRFCSLPVLFQTGRGVNILFSETDLRDYPGLFLAKADNGFEALFPKVVLETSPNPDRPDRSEIIKKESENIAHTQGDREFPWRVFIISDDDRDLLASSLMYQLASEPEIRSTKWIQPGKVAWDWWNANNIIGVDFNAGINTATYKYYIDFASEFGLEYIILDEGWSKSTTELLESNPDIDLAELIRYGREKNVGVILWVLWQPLDRNMDKILKTYAKWGAKGVKVDFMQRADQAMVNYYEKTARTAAKYKLLVDFHGAFKPAGLHRLYPNVVSFEGVKGLEHSKWSRDITPEHDVTLPFIRMVAGPMDYTPGAMDNASEKNFAIRFERPMSQGTRCHQVAMYVVYESPLQMLCDSPSNYYRERETADFIARIPTVWDETVVLEAAVAEYLVMARRNGEKWYIGALTDWTPREFELDFSFLAEGEYRMEIMQDGVNAHRHAQDYQKVITRIKNTDNMKIKLAAGGGWAAIISKKQDN